MWLRGVARRFPVLDLVGREGLVRQRIRSILDVSAGFETTIEVHVWVDRKRVVGIVAVEEHERRMVRRGIMNVSAGFVTAIEVDVGVERILNVSTGFETTIKVHVGVKRK